jgi:DNA-binding transcriptional LysR family regulator
MYIKETTFMDIKEFEYVLAIAEAGSLSLASEKLFLSQPSLSKFLKKLEKSLGTTLFMRTSTGIQLTNSGKIYVDNVEKLLQEYRRAQNKINDIENLDAGRVDFGISTYRGLYLFPKIFKKFNSRYPNVDIIVHEADSVVLEELILKGKIDMALVAKPEFSKDLKSYNLLEDEVVLVAHKDYPLKCKIHYYDNGTMWVNFKEISNECFLLSPPRTILGKVARSLFRNINAQANSLNQNCSAEMAVALASEGLGISFNYRSCCSNTNELNVYSIGKEKQYVPLILKYPSNDYRCRATTLLTNLIREYFA